MVCYDFTEQRVSFIGKRDLLATPNQLPQNTRRIYTNIIVQIIYVYIYTFIKTRFALFREKYLIDIMWMWWI